MSATTTAQIHCDGVLDRDGAQAQCPRQTIRWTNEEANSVREHLSLSGWTSETVDGKTRDYCPTCARGMR